MNTTTPDMAPSTPVKKRTGMPGLRRWLSRLAPQDPEHKGRLENGATQDIPRHEGSRTNGATKDIPKHEGSHENGATQDIPKPEGTQENGDDALAEDKDEDNAKDDATQENGDDAEAEDEDHDVDEDDEDEEDNDESDKAAVPEAQRDFWAEAWNSKEVGEERRALLRGTLLQTNTGNQKPRDNSQKAVEDVIKNTQKKMGSYTARWGSEDNKTVLGVARSILVSALRAKELVDATVRFDPSGYSTAAWAVVSLGLTLVQNDKELVESTFSACDYLAGLLARYARVEAQYRERKLEVKQGKPIRDALVRVYTAILVYAAEVQGSNKAKTPTRIKKSIQSLINRPLDDLKKKVDEESANLKEWLQQIDSERSDEARKKLNSIGKTTDDLLKKVDGTAKTSAKTLDKAKAEELRELYKWLQDNEGGSQQEIRKRLKMETDWWKNSGNNQLRLAENKGKGKVLSDNSTVETSDDGDGPGAKTGEIGREEGSENDDEYQDSKPRETAPGTSLEHNEDQSEELGGWLFQKGEYVDWIKYPQSLLWLYGPSNCGKSALCSTIIKNLQKTFKKDPKPNVLACWYFHLDLDESQKMDFFLVSLIRQIATQCQGFPEEKQLQAIRAYQDARQLPEETKELFLRLKRLISKVDRDVFLVLDGVDQVSQRHGTHQSDPKLLDIIKDLTHKAYRNLHILMISRDEKDLKSFFEKKMKDVPVSVDVGQELGQALDTFIEWKLDGISILKGDQTLREKIKARLKQDKTSNFLWAASVLTQVCLCRDVKEIQEALMRIPDNIIGKYQAALEKVADKDTPRMKSILLWLMRKQRPLSQAELTAFVDLLSPEAVTEICSRELVETAKERTDVVGRERELDVFRFTHFSVQEYLEDIFSRTPKELDANNKSSKIARFVPRPGEDAHLLITKRCLAVLSACASSQKSKAATAKTGSDTDSFLRASGSEASYGGVEESDAEGDSADGSETDQTRSTSSSTAVSECVEGPAQRYAAEYWFRHYNNIDRDKAAPGHLSEVENDVCSNLLLDKEKMRFWLNTYDPDGVFYEGDAASPVYYAVKLGLKGIPIRLVAQIARLHTDLADRRTALDQRGGEGTALQLAAHQGDSAVLEALIKHVDVNSEEGLHGTALYASAARGDVDAVDMLLKAGADPTGDDDGDLGSPLHVAAFHGHDKVIQLLLAHKDLAVDHRAGIFGTALQAAAASRSLSTIRLLLEKHADPSIVGGCLGTAAQAFMTTERFAEGDAGDVLETLQPKNASSLEGPLFWTLAYERATSQPPILGPRYQRGFGPSGSELSEAYTSLLRGPAARRSLRIKELQESQQLLASVIRQWTLPNADSVDGDRMYFDRIYRRLVSRVPFQDQLSALKRATPQRELSMQDLRRPDFLHKACFWAGINLILGELPRLVAHCLNRVYRLLRDEHVGIRRNTIPLRLAFAESEDPYYRGRYEEDEPPHPYFRYRTFPSRRQWNPWSTYPGPELDNQTVLGAINRNDVVAMELLQQRQRHRRLEETLQTTPLADGPDLDRDRQRDNAIREELQLVSHTGVWATSDVLDLVQRLVEYGGRCAHYQTDVPDMAKEAVQAYQKHVEDLTFELFSAVMRLALALDDYNLDNERLPQLVQLLTTVRLERIKQLDAICERSFAPKHKCDNASAETSFDSDLKVQEIARQVGQAIADKLGASQSDGLRDIQSHISDTIKEEVSRMVQQVKDGLGQEVRDEVQHQLAEAQAVPNKRGLLW